MENNLQVNINQRFKIVVDFLISENIIKNKSSLANKLDITNQKLSEILGLRMNTSTELISKICSIYDISAEWILTGEGEMKKTHINNNINIEQKYYKVLEEQNKLLKEKLEEYEKRIKSNIPIVQPPKELNKNNVD
jgi:plasmid maintenance system antidote protein VapI